MSLIIGSRWRIFWAIIFATSLSLAGCNGPSRARVRDDFLKDYPSAEIVRIDPTEGHADAVYYEIHFRLKSAPTTEKQTWLYVRQRNGWELRSKDIKQRQ